MIEVKRKDNSISMDHLDRPLNVRQVMLKNVTNTSITIEWEDENYNRNANITYYELVLK